MDYYKKYLKYKNKYLQLKGGANTAFDQYQYRKNYILNSMDSIKESTNMLKELYKHIREQDEKSMDKGEKVYHEENKLLDLEKENFKVIKKLHLDENDYDLVNELKKEINEFIEYIITEREINGTDKDGNTLVHHAINKGVFICLKILHQKRGDDVNLNIQNRYGNTPAHRAVQKNCIDCFKYLYDNGADLTIYDQNGHLPVNYVNEENIEDFYVIIPELIDSLADSDPDSDSDSN